MPIPLTSKLPYPLHTNRELGLMLRGIKPLAVFADGKGCFPEAAFRYLRLFDRYVAAGKLVRTDHFEAPNSSRDFTLHTILFALPDEAWRIPAMIEVRSSAQWSRSHERREGELLGYEDWMNDYFIDLKYQ